MRLTLRRKLKPPPIAMGGKVQFKFLHVAEQFFDERDRMHALVKRDDFWPHFNACDHTGTNRFYTPDEEVWVTPEVMKRCMADVMASMPAMPDLAPELTETEQSTLRIGYTYVMLADVPSGCSFQFDDSDVAYRSEGNGRWTAFEGGRRSMSGPGRQVYVTDDDFNRIVWPYVENLRSRSEYNARAAATDLNNI